MDGKLDLILTTRLLRGELAAASAHYARAPLDVWVANVKLAMVALSNVLDLSKQTRFLYEKHRGLSEKFRLIEDAVDFARYMRNIAVGHYNPALIEKAIEWHPVLRSLAATPDSQSDVLVNLFVIETAINTYVPSDSAHKLFDSETDLVYPPDWGRFCGYFEKTMADGLEYLNALLSALLTDYSPPVGFQPELAVKAGLTEFSFITKGKR
jgi:hypothetical protein